jgi:hypothetical protein
MPSLADAGLKPPLTLTCQLTADAWPLPVFLYPRCKDMHAAVTCGRPALAGLGLEARMKVMVSWVLLPRLCAVC